MINFMFAVLGSTLFWVGFFVVGFVITTYMYRFVCPNSYNFLIKGKLISNNSDSYFYKYEYSGIDDGDRKGAAILIFILLFLFWPIVLFFILLGYSFKFIFGCLLINAIRSTDKIIPTVKFEKSKEDSDKDEE